MADAARTDIRDTRNGNIRETRVIERRRGGGWGALIAFLIGGILIGAAAVLLMNVHGTLSWPAGRLDFNLSPVSSSTQPANTAAVNTLATDTATANAPAAAPVAPAANTPSVAPPVTTPSDTAATPQTAPTPDAQTPDSPAPSP